MARRFKTASEARSYVESLPISTLMNLCTELLLEKEESRMDRITITKEQFDAFFKVRGLTADGEKEPRGRKPKEPTLL